MALSRHCLTPVIVFSGIWSLVGFGTSFEALALPELYLQKIWHEASPKAISRRTSYLRVRLEFLRYPQFILSFCSRNRYGPPPPFTVDSAWPWVDHSVSGLVPTTQRPIWTRFRCGSPRTAGLTLLLRTNSLARYAKSTPSPLAGLRHLVSK